MIILEEKKSLRKKVRDFEKSYLGELGELDLSLCENILSLPEYRSAQSIFAFVPFGNEPNILCVLEDALLKGKKLAVPRCKKNGEMEAVMIQNLSSLIPGMYGILEPGSEQKGTLERELTDLVLVPGAAFSRDFMRMGRGGGYYDRYLSEYFGIRVGVAREYMLFDKIPSEGHDQKVDILITEKKIYR